MQQVRSFFAAFLVGILMVTLLSPHFGWEVVASESELGHALGDQHKTMAADWDTKYSSIGGEEPHATDHHHGCAGHQFSHTPAQASASHAWHPAPTSQAALPSAAISFQSFIPPGLYRPPLLAAA